MKNLIKVFISFVGFLLLTAPAANAIGHQFDVSPVIVQAATVATVFVSYLLFKPASQPNVFVAGVEVEMWVNYIIERLWKNNDFLKRAYSDDQYVLAGKIVHIPQPGSAPEVVKNRSVFPAVAVQRTDTDINYSLDMYTTTPTHILDAEKIEASYDKIDSIFGDHAGTLAQFIADDMIVKWLTGIGAGQKLLTTGAATLATAPSGTGNRKAVTVEDLRRSMTKMNIDNIPQENRIAVIPSNMLDQLTSGLAATQYRDFTQHYDAAKGIVGKLYSFDIVERSSTAVSNAGTVKAVGAAGAAADNEVAVLYQQNAVARALGEVKFFENVNDPQYYGDVYSASLRMGGRRRRSDDKGIIMLSQDASA